MYERQIPDEYTITPLRNISQFKHTIKYQITLKRNTEQHTKNKEPVKYKNQTAMVGKSHQCNSIKDCCHIVAV